MQSSAAKVPAMSRPCLLPSLPLLLMACLGDVRAAVPVELPPPLTPYTEEAQTAPRTRPEEALSVNEPIYFLLGGSRDFTARFQLSFKYRIFDEHTRLVRTLPPIGGLYLAYTQTSLWDLSEESMPFEDTSYRPSVFWLYDSGRRGLLPRELRLGYEHESNGQGELTSRSIDTLIFQPRWETAVNGRKLELAPKLLLYLQDKGNPDIKDYRGDVAWIARYGRETSWIWHGQFRYGRGGHATAQLDISYPLRAPLLARSGAFFHVQLLHGYGETLLNYNEHVGLRLWLGLSLVR